MDNEIAILTSITRDGKSWLAEGEMDDEVMRVTLWNEHKRAVTNAGYKLTWDSPQSVKIEPVTIALFEDNGRRRVAAVLKRGTDDEWVEVEQKR